MDPTKSDKTEPSPQPPPFVADEDGDLILRIGSTEGTKDPERDFRVCSAAMRRSSPVFKKMLFGPWVESKANATDGGAQWIVHLPEDEPAPFQVLLAIIHGLFSQAKVTKVGLLYQMMIIVDKYDLFHLITPFAQKWNDEAKIGVNKRQGADTPHLCELHLAYIAWGMGDEHQLAYQVRHLVLDCAVDEAGELIYPWGAPTPNTNLSAMDHLGPPDLLEVVAKHRLTIIGAILEAFNKEVQTRLHGNVCRCSNHYNTNERMKCDQQVLGGIWKGLVRRNRPNVPRVEATEEHMSPHDLVREFQAIFDGIPALDGNHPRCGPSTSFKETAREIMMRPEYRVAGILTPEWKARMEKQRKKLGF
ncbi:hypothetical protein QBC44DRAFT_271454 [Cladorrhinum sp. PSN332]|nr:hypothetical protein QBC44DRAFT_271454 [Cladorrhinum sp. PSN332]